MAGQDMRAADWITTLWFVVAGMLIAGCGAEPTARESAAVETPDSDAPEEPRPPGDGSLAPSARFESTRRASAPRNVARPAETEPAFTDDDYRRHIESLRAKLVEHRLSTDDFHIVIAKPFVVIGDQPPATVERWAERTVSWAVKRLKQDFFRRDPTSIVDIWLFKNKASYEKHTESLLGRRPHTPFGYYSPRDRALVMNISTGGGTLVHEIVHPFVAADFPACPAWLNEGLGSLFEQCSERDGQIRGETNWRLRGLQRAIDAGRLPSFETLCGTTTHEFYQEDPGTNYAQARYLCYYLQEHDLLRTFYREFRKSHQSDPTGFVTLQDILDEEDMPAFQVRWEEWVMTLRFPG